MAETTVSKQVTRKQEARPQEWKEPNELEIPEEVVARLKAEDCEPRWIRILIEGREDANNIMTRLREGYQFVKRESVEDIWPEVPSYEHGRHGNLILVGDLALAKLSISISKSRKAAMSEKTRNLTEAIDRNLWENSPKHLNQMMPVSNNSRTQVYRGRNVQVDGD